MGLAAILSLGLIAAPQLWSATAQNEVHSATSTPFTLPPTITLPTIPATTPKTTVTTPPIITTPTVTLPPVTRPRTTVTRPPGSTVVTTAAPTTTTTSTTIAPIPAGAPPPVTLPLASEPQSATISPVFSVLSGIGFVSLIGLLLAQWYLTGPNRRGPTL